MKIYIKNLENLIPTTLRALQKAKLSFEVHDLVALYNLLIELPI